MSTFLPLADNAEQARHEVRQLAAGRLTRATRPRRVISYQLVRQGRPVLKLEQVRNVFALPPERRRPWMVSVC